MMKIIVLDFSEPKAYIFDFDTSIYSTEEDGVVEFFDDVNNYYSLHLRTANCQWMIAEHLEMEIH